MLMASVVQPSSYFLKRIWNWVDWWFLLRLLRLGSFASRQATSRHFWGILLCFFFSSIPLNFLHRYILFCEAGKKQQTAWCRFQIYRWQDSQLTFMICYYADIFFFANVIWGDHFFFWEVPHVQFRDILRLLKINNPILLIYSCSTIALGVFSSATVHGLINNFVDRVKEILSFCERSFLFMRVSFFPTLPTCLSATLFSYR